MSQVKQVLIVGGGSAGFMAALALRSKLPQLSVRVIRSPEIGIIGVGEGSTPQFTRFLHEFLKVPIDQFVTATMPGLKTGTCFHWGPRPRFFFPFGPYMALRANELPRAIGYYFDYGNPETASPASARMQADRVFQFKPDGSLQLDFDFAYHVENQRFTQFLESTAIAAGVQIIDGTVETVSQNEAGIESLHLANGQILFADLYIDCSGFRSLLLGKTFGEPFVDYKKTLLCDRAVVGGWERPAGLLMVPYTVSETMNSGWCWRIDHPDRINRGYVYSSAYICDEDAEQELRTKNPMIGPTRVVKFTSGRYQRSWVKNVVAMGNASGFVEPLEATSLAILSMRCILLTELLGDSDCHVTPPQRQIYNQNTASVWDSVRDFLALHYRFNTRLSTPFWRACQTQVDLANAEPLVDYYQHVGPSPLHANAFVNGPLAFGPNSYLAILAGQRVQSHHPFHPTSSQLVHWQNWCNRNAIAARHCPSTEQALAMMTHRDASRSALRA